MRSALITGLLTVATLLGSSAATAAPLDRAEHELVAEVNAFRASQGLPALVASEGLNAAAKWMAIDMATLNYFSHTSSDGRDHVARISAFGYPARSTWTGENLAAGYTRAVDVVRAWIASPGHHAVLTNAHFRAIGVGRAYDAASTHHWYWAANFGGHVDAPVVSAQAPAPRVAAVEPAPAAAAEPADADTAVEQQAFSAAWEGQSPHVTLGPGNSTTLVLALRNTGYQGWHLDTPGHQALIGTSEPLDAPRPELADGWLTLNRPATMSTPYVGPGQVAWFQFTVRAPLAPGTYRLAVRGVIEGMTWLEDAGIYWTIEVR